MTIIYEKEQIETVIRELRAGKVIAFPTDTVYGLGVCYDDEDALQRLKAVSYTHLDVYKRQVLGGVIRAMEHDRPVSEVLAIFAK